MIAGHLWQNAPLHGVVPTEGRWFAVDRESGELVVTAADGRLWRLDAGTLAATPTTKEHEQPIRGDYLRGLAKWSAGPGLGAAPLDYTLQGDLLETRWIGLLTPDDLRRPIAADFPFDGEPARGTRR